MDQETIQGRVPIAKAAEILKMDSQTVRLLIQNKLVDWGFCYKRPGSSQFSYVIYAEKFFQATGYRYEK